LVVLNLALCIGSTGAGARVDAALVEARPVAWALGVDRTLRAAVRWHANVVGEAGAGSNPTASTLPAGGELATGGRVAGVHRRGPGGRRGDNHSCALAEGVTSETWRALADRVVVGDLASGVVAADAGARVHTLLVDAGGQLVAVRADDTLGPTCWGDALVGGEAGAHTHSIDLLVLTVGATRVWVARRPFFFHRLNDEGASGDRVPFVVRVAGADGVVVPD
jgi:hypothetical protein